MKVGKFVMFNGLLLMVLGFLTDLKETTFGYMTILGIFGYIILLIGYVQFLVENYVEEHNKYYMEKK